MRQLEGWANLSILTPEVLQVLQLCDISEPLFPNLETLKLCPATGEFTPYIPLFLSPRTTTIDILFTKTGHHEVAIASLLSTSLTQCPNLQSITLHGLPRDPMIAMAVSGMLLANNRNSLRFLQVGSQLTEEAHEVICQLPSLRHLWVDIEEGISSPSMVLPNLTDITIEHGHGSTWSQMFSGATLRKLQSVTFMFRSEQSDDLLERFEGVALAASIHTTLSEFHVHTSTSWNPTYSSLLPFTQLVHLTAQFSCGDVCSSSVDDDVITNLAQAMPRLETLQLGDSPCSRILTGVTAKGLLVLARHCLDLSWLCLHFHVTSFSDSDLPAVARNSGPTVTRRDCALKVMDVGKICLPEESELVVALTLARIFPQLECVGGWGRNWGYVADAIRVSRQLVSH